MRRRRLILLGAAILGGAAALPWLSASPTNDRDWQPNQAVLPWTEFFGDSARVHNVRNTVYRSDEDYTPVYADRTLDLRQIRRVWFLVVPFGAWGGSAHTFLSFEFDGPSGPEFLAISVEARRERDESYSFVSGAFRRYELMYVVADERDAIGLRATHWREAVYLYPMRAAPSRARDLFVGMLERANGLRERPEFYNTLTANCTNTIQEHVNRLSPGRVPFSLKVVFPGYADRLAYELGLIDTDLPWDSVRTRFRVDERARAASADAAGFSVRIRAGLAPTSAAPPPRRL
jgi:hypothetical protein